MSLAPVHYAGVGLFPCVISVFSAISGEDPLPHPVALERVFRLFSRNPHFHYLPYPL